MFNLLSCFEICDFINSLNLFVLIPKILKYEINIIIIIKKK